MNRLIVCAVGGNALISDPAHVSFEDQEAVARRTAERIIGMVKQGWKVALTHGNGPQVGFELIRSAAAAERTPPLPMDACGAATQGLIGTMLVRGLRHAAAAAGLSIPIVSIVTHMVVDAADPAFARPTKPVGPFYDADTAAQMARTQGWTVIEDAGRGWRRVVASPQPFEIAELDSIRTLVEAGALVVACGGGGIPVFRKDGDLTGAAAVIDKDLASGLLARSLGADRLIVATDVRRVQLDRGRPEQRDIDQLTSAEGLRYLAEGQFPAGSMGPKVRACAEFVGSSGTAAAICHLDDLAEAADGKAGTQFIPEAALV